MRLTEPALHLCLTKATGLNSPFAMQNDAMILTAILSRGHRGLAWIYSSKPMSMLVVLAVALTIGILVLTPDSGAADDASSLAPRFEFNCQTRENDFYDWVETNIWNSGASQPAGSKPRKALRRTLGGAIEALTRNPSWVIQLSSISCPQGAGMSQRRRESLFFMIDDARTEGAGKVEPAPGASALFADFH